MRLTKLPSPLAGEGSGEDTRGTGAHGVFAHRHRPAEALDPDRPADAEDSISVSKSRAFDKTPAVVRLIWPLKR